MNTNIESIAPTLEQNVGMPERIISIISGSFLMCNALSSKGSIKKTLTAGFLLFRGTTGYCPGYQLWGKTLGTKSKNINIYTSVRIEKSPEEIYKFWRNLENLPLFMNHLESVTAIDDRTSEWKARIPGGLGTISWKGVIAEDIPNERISWHSLPGATVENAGNVQFLGVGKNVTDVYVFISYRSPAGKTGEGIAKLLNQIFENMIREDIKNFKNYIEG